MRATLVRCLSLTICFLAATGCARVEYKPSPQAKVATVAPADVEHKVTKDAKVGKATQTDKKVEPLTWTVQGWGKTEEAAKEHAMKNAREKLIAHLRSLQPPLVWTPTLDDVRKFVQLSQPQRCPDQDTMVDGEQMQCWSWSTNPLESQLGNLRREDAKYRAQLGVQERSAAAEERMLGLSKLVGGLVLALAAVWLYVKVAQTAGRKTATD